MTTRTLRDAAVGLFYILVILALIALSILFYNHAFTKYTTVALRADSVGNALIKGSDVQVRGVEIGTVSAIDTDGDGSVVHLRLTPGKITGLPANMTAQLLPKTLFGERYVALQFPSSPSSSHLASGDTIQQDNSKSSVELQQVFQDLLPVLQSIKPEKLSATLGELALALRNEGDNLGQTVETVTSYLDRLAPHVPQLTRDLKQFAQVAGTYNDAAPNLIAGLNALTTTTQTFVRQQNDYQVLLNSATGFARTTDSFLGANQNSIIGLSRNSLPSLRITAKYASEFPCLARSLVNYIPVANKAFGATGKQPGAHVILHVIPRVGPYTLSDKPVFNDNGPARCPYSPATAVSNTALADLPGIAGAQTQAVPMGAANSPQENEMIAELMAPTEGIKPADYPKWASLVVGPALRGSSVTVK